MPCILDFRQSQIACSKSRNLSNLPPLYLSLPSFSRLHPLFSVTYSLFCQNTGGGVYADRPLLWNQRHTDTFFSGCLQVSYRVAGKLPRSSRAVHCTTRLSYDYPPYRSAATMNFMKLKSLCIALSFLLPALLPTSASAQTVEEVIAKVIAARGGLHKMRAIHSERVSGKISFGEVTGPFVVELKRPLKMHMQLTVQNQTMVRVYDGKSQGWANNPFAGKMNPDVMSEEELKNITEESDFDGPLVDYKSKGNQVELVGKDKVNDKDAWRLKLTTKHGDVRSYLFDANSFFLLKWEGKRKYEGQEIPVESYFSDYREVGGLKFAFAIDSGSSATDITQKIRIEKIELNPELNDAEFTKPPTPPQLGAPPPTSGQPPA